MSEGINKFLTKKGFSLIEVLIAFAIFVLAVYPFISILTYSTKANVKSVMAIQAVNLAMTQLEELKYGGRFDNDKSGFAALRALLKDEMDRQGANKWVEYVREYDYGKIVAYPKYKKKIAVSFFPEVSPQPQLFYTPMGSMLPVPNPKALPEYVKLISRIKINVTVWWHDETGNEHNFTAYTIVTEKK